MTVQERIKQFGGRNAPFYICDHKNGENSLCLPLDFLSGDYKSFVRKHSTHLGHFVYQATPRKPLPQVSGP